MNLQQTLLHQIEEECLEIAHACSKAIRFGLNDHWKDKPTDNQQDIANEFNDLFGAIEALAEFEGTDFRNTYNRTKIDAKKAKIRAMMEYSISRGQLPTNILPAEKKNDAEEFLQTFKHVPMKIRENCLEDMACPCCGDRNAFRIGTKVEAVLYDSGSDRENSDLEFDGSDRCVCDTCGHRGNVNRFTFEGLDDLLKLRRKGVAKSK